MDESVVNLPGDYKDIVQFQWSHRYVSARFLRTLFLATD